jgi:tetratricopeptide (TPR) repeat protein/ferredoxin
VSNGLRATVVERAPSYGRGGGTADRQERAEPIRRRRNYGRWRAATLAGVYVLMVAHIVHWKIAGRTLAPLELNEVMYTLELGIITAGFIFMALAVLATLIFGRFFCSWGCHILALEDLSFWILKKLRIRPRPVRSRMLRWVPLVAMFYMFVWPQVSRLLAGRPLPEVRVQTDAQGWASFLTTDFWRNLPGPGITILTFVLSGFFIVYLLGSRAFCTYACPYGAIFRLADRFAPGRIVARGDCAGCGHCTAACQSQVRVHEELVAYGRVVNPACMKDLDCVAACPDGRVAYGLGRPAILDLLSPAAVRRVPYDFSRGEDVLMAVVFVAALLIFRGLYGTVPFLLTLALGGMFAYIAVLAVRLVRRPHLRLNPFQFKTAGRLSPAGYAFAGVCVLLAVFTVHSGLIRYHEFAGQRQAGCLAALAGAPDEFKAVDAALGHHEFCERWGLFRSAVPPNHLAALYERRGGMHAAARHHTPAVADYEKALALQPEPAACGRLETSLGVLALDRGDPLRAVHHLSRAAHADPGAASIHYHLALAHSVMGRNDEAVAEYERTLVLDASDAEAHNNLGFLLAGRGDPARAEDHFERAIRLRPEFAHPYFNLGRIRLTQGRRPEAERLFRIAARLDPAYATLFSDSGAVPQRTAPGR